MFKVVAHTPHIFWVIPLKQNGKLTFTRQLQQILQIYYYDLQNLF